MNKLKFLYNRVSSLQLGVGNPPSLEPQGYRKLGEITLPMGKKLKVNDHVPTSPGGDRHVGDLGGEALLFWQNFMA